MIEAPAPGDPAGAVPAGAGPTGEEDSPRVKRSAGRARRPAMVTILAVLQLLTSALYATVVAALLLDGPATMTLLIGDAPGSQAGGVGVATAIVVIGGFTAAALTAGVLLLRMRQLGWTLTMLLTGVSLSSSIATWWAQGTTIPIWLFIQVATVFYLNQRQVREAFGISRRGAGGASSPAGDAPAEAPG